VSVDPDHLLPEQVRLKFQQLLQEYDHVFDPKITGYNGSADPIQATVNIGLVQPPKLKERIPQYSRNQLVGVGVFFSCDSNFFRCSSEHITSGMSLGESLLHLLQ